MNVSLEMLEKLLQTTRETELFNTAVSNVNDAIELSQYLNILVQGYKEFCRQTLAGDKGKTAQYHYLYCEFVNLFLRFSRSIRTCNIGSYIDSIFNICDLFFGLNQPNYARWGLLYVSNLIRLYTENSPWVSEFRRGAFGVRRRYCSELFEITR